MKAIDGDSHFMEPMDLFERYIDVRFRDRAYRVEKDPATGRLRLVVDQKPLQLVDVEELLGAVPEEPRRKIVRDTAARLYGLG